MGCVQTIIAHKRYWWELSNVFVEQCATTNLVLNTYFYYFFKRLVLSREKDTFEPSVS
jgi:hypothetical protein